MALRMPRAVRSTLLDMDLSTTPAALYCGLRLSREAYANAKAGELGTEEQVIKRRKGLLTSEACARLRRSVDSDYTTARDTVDNAPDHQQTLSHEQLVELASAQAVRGIRELAHSMAGGKSMDSLVVQYFIRRYSATTRPWIPFHCDSAWVTCNVALVDDAAFDGGKLLAVYGWCISLSISLYLSLSLFISISLSFSLVLSISLA